MIESRQSSNIPSMSNKQHNRNMYAHSITGEDITDMTINRNDYPLNLDNCSFSRKSIMHRSQKPLSLTMNMIPDPEEMKEYNEYKKGNSHHLSYIILSHFLLCHLFSHDT